MPLRGRRHVVFHVGGPNFHPVDQQARLIGDWLGDGFTCDIREGIDAFDDFATCDLLVIMGLHWPGMADPAYMGGGNELRYRPLDEEHWGQLARFAASGRPILAHHGGIASYPDRPTFGQIVGFIWDEAVSRHSPYDRHRISVLRTGHPVVGGVDDFDVMDEIYFNVLTANGLSPRVHAHATWDGQQRPMVMTAEGRGVVGGGRRVFLANGHDLRTFECVALQQLWRNSVMWLLSD